MTHVLYECGICESLHPWDWDGDCRDDANRYADAEDYAGRSGVSAFDVEVRSMEDRLAAGGRRGGRMKRVKPRCPVCGETGIKEHSIVAAEASVVGVEFWSPIDRPDERHAGPEYGGDGSVVDWDSLGSTHFVCGSCAYENGEFRAFLPPELRGPYTGGDSVHWLFTRGGGGGSGKRRNEKEPKPATFLRYGKGARVQIDVHEERGGALDAIWVDAANVVPFKEASDD